MVLADGRVSEVIAAMAHGIGDLSFGSHEWIEAARDALAESVDRHAAELADLGRFTLCEVAHNPPTHLHCQGPLAWHARFDGATVDIAAGALEDDACDYKMEGDHSAISNLARIMLEGRDPAVVAAAQARLRQLSRWKVHGALPQHPALGAVLGELHDVMASRTMPRLCFMTPEWVSSARHILTTRANSEKYRDSLNDVVYTFAEEFTDTPSYAFPDGSHGGFWVRCDHGRITVGAGPLPQQLEPADRLTKGLYAPVVPVGRTVDAALTDEDKAAVGEYAKAAFRFDKAAGRRPVEQTMPSQRGEMPDALSRVFRPLHDELSKRTSGEIPADYETNVDDRWAGAQSFDRRADYDPSWLRYDKVDIFGRKRG